jgi:hypothetical protein
MQESLSDRVDRLSAGGRVREIDRLLTEVEAARGAAEGDFNALSMLVVDAIRELDEFALELSLVRLQRLYGIWDERSDSDAAEQQGRIRAMADVSSTALEQLVPLSALAGIEPGSRAHQFLSVLQERSGLSNAQLVEALGSDPADVSRIGRRLHDAGLARKRRYGRRNAWDITPRGLKAVGILDSGELPRFQRPHLVH